MYPTTEITSVHAVASLWLAAASPWSVDGIATASLPTVHAGRPTGNLISHFADLPVFVIAAVVLDDDAFRGAG